VIAVAYSFGSFVLEPVREELRRGTQAVEISRQAFAILACLARNHPRCVAHGELLAAAWLGAAIGDGSLRLAIWEARRVLATDPSLCRAIQTTRGKGYRFDAPVVRTMPELSPTCRDALFGRADELSRLTEMLKEATHVEGRACAIMGQAGIGKTRLMRELARCALEREIQVWEGRGERDRGAPALWPWIQMLKEQLDGTDDRMREYCKRATPRVWQLATSLSSGTASKSVPLDMPETRFTLFAEFVRLLVWSSARKPLLLLFDDLHCADESSHALFAYVVRELRTCRTFLVAACRHVTRTENPGAARALEALSQEPLNQRMPLRALNNGALGNLLTDQLRETVSAPLVARIHQITGGNPRLALELVQLLSSEVARDLGSEPERRVVAARRRVGPPLRSAHARTQRRATVCPR
jgi:DNA-binding winged helix-turn-helix (wHTH) protein